MIECGKRASVDDQVCAYRLGLNPNQTRAAKHPRLQKVSLNPGGWGEGGGSKPPLCWSPFSCLPAPLPTTVPVLGCSSLDESYPSLASQPSSGAIQGDVKLVSEREAIFLEKVSFFLLGRCMPCGFQAQHLSCSIFTS